MKYSWRVGWTAAAGAALMLAAPAVRVLANPISYDSISSHVLQGPHQQQVLMSEPHSQQDRIIQHQSLQIQQLVEQLAQCHCQLDSRQCSGSRMVYADNVTEVADPLIVSGTHIRRHMEPIPPLQYWLTIVAIGVLVVVGGIVAGLTIGLMSLDETNLSILKISGTQLERAYVSRIEPIRKNSHLLLVTLLLTNTIVNETLPIMFDAIHLQGWQAVLSSTVLIVIFGEIIPQAVCARYGLQIGAFFAWPVRILIFIAWIVAYPISQLLDAVLGHRNGVVYRHAELKELVAMHGEDQAGPLTKDEVSVLRAVLDLRDKSVQNVMTKLSDVFMLPLSAKLDLETMQTITQAGHSRVPVYDTDNRHTVIGVVLVKQLIVFDPEQQIPVKSIRIRPLPRVLAHTPLFDMLHIFEAGGSHMALVVEQVCSNDGTCDNRCYSDPCNEETQPLLNTDQTDTENTNDEAHVNTPASSVPTVFRALGVVTLEDVIEEILGEEIIDETDVYVDMASKVKVAHALRDPSQFRHLLVSPRITGAELPLNRNESSVEQADQDAELATLLASPTMLRQWSSPRLRGTSGSDVLRSLVARRDMSQSSTIVPAEETHVHSPMLNLPPGVITLNAAPSGANEALVHRHHSRSSTQTPAIKGCIDTSSLAPITVSQKYAAMAASALASNKVKRKREKDLVPAQDLATMFAENTMLVYTPHHISASNSARYPHVQVDESPQRQEMGAEDEILGEELPSIMLDESTHGILEKCKEPPPS
ncbi:hypothetical protein BASA83_003820 [Batrachochytrium salamandrivorans]|nr:hypothetical protein BASA62_005507 [Batrachochytrium salamandrivorans]KAH9273826.1 hypothetical protein BASA83_003820 [Batrachochytrium salamandrivorans]